MSDGPLIVQSDRTVLLEVAHPDAETARHELAVFAELERAPEHIHTYRVTRLGLWNARAAGHQADDMLETLERWSRFPVPPSVSIDISETVGRYGRLLIERDDEGTLVLRSHRRGGARRDRQEQAHPAAADRPPHPRFVHGGCLGPRPHQAGAAEDRVARRRPRRLHAPAPRTRSSSRRTAGTCAPTSARPSTASPTAARASSCCPVAPGKTLVGRGGDGRHRRRRRSSS